MADWLGPVVSGVIEFAGTFVPVKRADPRLQNAPLRKRLLAMLLIVLFGLIGTFVVILCLLGLIAFLAKG